MRLFARILTGPAVVIALCGFLFSGCSSTKVVDTVKFWDAPKSQRIQPTRYDGKESKPAASVQTEQAAEPQSVAQTAPPETGVEKAITETTVTDEAAPASDPQLSPAERKLQERVDKRAEAIRAKHRTKNSIFSVF